MDCDDDRYKIFIEFDLSAGWDKIVFDFFNYHYIQIDTIHRIKMGRHPGRNLE